MVAVTAPEAGARARPSIHVVCFTGTSGLTHYALSLARELQRHAETTLVVGAGYDREGYPRGDYRVLRMFRRSRWYPVDLARFIAHLLRARPDIVVFQSVLKSATIEGLVVRLMRLAGIRTFITVHDVLPHYPRAWSRLSRRWFYRGADGLIAHSQRARRELMAMGIQCPIAVLPHGAYDIFITRPLDSRTARQRLTPFAEGHFVLLFFGAIDSRKGIDAFLALEPLLANEGTRLVVAGRNGIKPHETRLAATLAAARVSPNCLIRDDGIRFDEVQDYLALADLVVLPYLEGTTSGVLKLALAAGKPVLATDVGDHAETLQSGIGALVRAGAGAVELADGVRAIRRDYSRFQEASRQAGVKYAWPGIGDAYADFLLADLR